MSIYDGLLEEQNRVVEKLRYLFRSDSTIYSWLNSPNALLHGKTPMSYIYRFEGDRLVNIIESSIR